MRTQIVSLQKMINMRNEEENRDHEEGMKSCTGVLLNIDRSVTPAVRTEAL